ncbi:acyltransferase domain-containing protein [Streptomyces sp. AM2-3-1]|uniref:ACP S-malonyltransferase n=1 Tax=Streptomyces sp. AM2-3-1 TaxID=3075824 RepID=UPI0028C4BE62|nr:acyltransferase domain-containing protein [Streptomyces sp. AM2-3-1]WNO62449.1 acyltransferase domain-containing protein [Streptomyces sp. AM2-3-1]
MNVAVLFPGQGSQRTGMLQSLPDTPAAAQAHTEARDVLRSFDDVPAQLDTFEALRSTTNTQLALLIAGVVTARALVDDHDLRADSVAGHSVGAFSAAVIAGVLSLSDALRVVRVRGHGMERACANGAWSMAALSGLNLASSRQLLATVATDADPLWVANINAADQIVVSGTRTALDTLRRRAPAAGVRDLKLLDVSVASHCPLQADTARAVAHALAQTERGEQQSGYFANTTGRRLLHAPERIIDDLAQAVQQPVRWYDVVRLMPELGVTATIQVPPGHVLTAIVTRENPSMTNVAVDDTGLTTAVRRVTRARGT